MVTAYTAKVNSIQKIISVMHAMQAAKHALTVITV